MRNIILLLLFYNYYSLGTNATIKFLTRFLAQWTQLRNNTDNPNWGTRYVFAETNTPGLRNNPIMFAGQDTRYLFLGFGLQTVSCNTFFSTILIYF